METKFCKRCQQEHPLTTEFWIIRRGRGSECREVNRARARKNYVYKPRNLTPEQVRDKMMRARYGITQAQYLQLAEAQDNKCAICHLPANEAGRGMLYVDHNHTNGEIRGLLCSSCNTGLGHIGDTVEALTKAKAYLERQTVEDYCI